MTVIKESHLFSITAVLTAPAATSREQTAVAAAAATAAATAVTDNTPNLVSLMLVCCA